ncbi:MAG: FHA domain-containing protein [Chloroflexota bacterium]|nr:FHA domain-containing protein [Chloroflexota bacterium]
MEATLNGPFGQTTLGPGAVTIGRAPDNQLSLNDTQASSHHAEIRPEGQGYVLIDKGSTNGTFVNEQRVDSNVPRLLIAGDRIRVGGTVFTYETSGGSLAEKTMLAGPPDFGAMPQQNYQQAPQGYPQQPPPAYPQQPQQNYQQAPQGYPQQPPPAYPQQPQQNYQQAPQGYPQQPPPAYPQQAPQGYPQQPPSAYPQQAPQSYPQQQPVARKKSRAGCVIAVLVVLVLLAAGVVFAYLRIPAVQGLLGGSTPDKTVQAYCNAIKNKDAVTAYDQLSKRSQSQFSEQQFAQLIQLIPAASNVSSCSTSNVQITGSTATADVMSTSSNGKTQTGHEKFVLENGVWKLDGGQSVNP